jgi:hypothetical protein
MNSRVASEVYIKKIWRVSTYALPRSGSVTGNKLYFESVEVVIN